MSTIYSREDFPCEFGGNDITCGCCNCSALSAALEATDGYDREYPNGEEQ